MEQLELTLSGNAYLGSSFGRDNEGRVIFVPYSIPGERAHIEISESHRRWARAKILSLLEPSPQRLKPRCIHYMECGGCHYQHMSYELQLAVKAEVVRSQLERIGGFSDPPVARTIPSPSPWNTRNHIQFSLDQTGKLGFRAANSDRVVPIEECWLPHPEIARLWPLLNVADQANLERVAFRVGDPGEVMIILLGPNKPDIEMEINFPASVVWIEDHGYSVLAGDSAIQITILDRTFHVSGGSFFQVHSDLTSDLVTLVMDALDLKPDQTILDLYAGVGLFSAFVAEIGARVIAVEQSAWAAKDFVFNLDEFNSVELYEAAVEMVLPSLRIQPDRILIDPPRAGLGPDVTEEIIRLSPTRLVYVSCDPSTLARDGKTLMEGGYTLKSVLPIDLFPQTFHIETISIWQKR
jgi:23S rRNA (uracil1939-C5)-methyltransferase